MCTAPKISSTISKPAPIIATPTYADASVSKANLAQKSNSSNRNVKTSARGLLDEAVTTKKGLLGE